MVVYFCNKCNEPIEPADEAKYVIRLTDPNNTTTWSGDFHMVCSSDVLREVMDNSVPPAPVPQEPSPEPIPEINPNPSNLPQDGSKH